MQFSHASLGAFAVLVALHEAPNGTRRDRYNELSRDLLGGTPPPPDPPYFTYARCFLCDLLLGVSFA